MSVLKGRAYLAFHHRGQCVAVVEYPTLDQASEHITSVVTEGTELPFEWDGVAFHPGEAPSAVTHDGLDLMAAQ